MDKEEFKPWSHLVYDDNLNFGRTGTIWKYREMYKDIAPAKFWDGYVEHLKKKGEEDGVDYFKED